MKLTIAQRRQLVKLAKWKPTVPEETAGWPGCPEDQCDAKALPKLRDLGLVEDGIFSIGAPAGGVAKWWRATPLGIAEAGI